VSGLAAAATPGLSVSYPVKAGRRRREELHSRQRQQDGLLANGDIVASGPTKVSEPSSTTTVAVIGGTGAYALARGTATLTPGEVSGKNGFLATIDRTTT